MEKNNHTHTHTHIFPTENIIMKKENYKEDVVITLPVLWSEDDYFADTSISIKWNQNSSANGSIGFGNKFMATETNFVRLQFLENIEWMKNWPGIKQSILCTTLKILSYQQTIIIVYMNVYYCASVICFSYCFGFYHGNRSS